MMLIKALEKRIEALERASASKVEPVAVEPELEPEEEVFEVEFDPEPLPEPPKPVAHKPKKRHR